MPDICMCSSVGCSVSKACRRHPDSGTVPDDELQVFAGFEPDRGIFCNGFLPHERYVVLAHSDGRKDD